MPLQALQLYKGRVGKELRQACIKRSLPLVKKRKTDNHPGSFQPVRHARSRQSHEHSVIRSGLDPARLGRSSSQALRHSLELARLADQLGYRRYWFAEHHNMSTVLSTT